MTDFKKALEGRTAWDTKCTVSEPLTKDSIRRQHDAVLLREPEPRPTPEVQAWIYRSYDKFYAELIEREQ